MIYSGATCCEVKKIIPACLSLSHSENVQAKNGHHLCVEEQKHVVVVRTVEMCGHCML